MTPMLLNIAIHTFAILLFACVLITSYSIYQDLRRGYIDLGKNFLVAHWKNRKLLFIRYFVLKIFALLIGVLYLWGLLSQLTFLCLPKEK